jgi:hypothetical protein
VEVTTTKPEVSYTYGWTVSDNGENVVAFLPEKGQLVEQADFGRKFVGRRGAVADLIDRLGSGAFRERVEFLHRNDRHILTLEDFGSDVTHTEHVRLYGWETFPAAASPVRALLFGELVKRAIGVTRSYLSDLYHDAEFLTENVNGEVTFDWLTRECGTNIGESACIAVKIGAGCGARFYRVRVYDKQPNHGEWWVEFTEVPLDTVADLDPIDKD